MTTPIDGTDYGGFESDFGYDGPSIGPVFGSPLTDKAGHVASEMALPVGIIGGAIVGSQVAPATAMTMGVLSLPAAFVLGIIGFAAWAPAFLGGMVVLGAGASLVGVGAFRKLEGK